MNSNKFEFITTKRTDITHLFFQGDQKNLMFSTLHENFILTTFVTTMILLVRSFKRNIS